MKESTEEIEGLTADIREEDYKEIFELKKNNLIKKIGDLEKGMLDVEIQVLDLPSVKGSEILE